MCLRYGLHMSILLLESYWTFIHVFPRQLICSVFQRFQSFWLSFSAALDVCPLHCGGRSKYINHMMPSPNSEALSPETEEDMTSSSSGEISVVVRSSTGSRSSQSMDDSLSRLSVDRSPARTSSGNKTVACMTDIGSLVRRVKNVRVVYNTPETCVWAGTAFCVCDALRDVPVWMKAWLLCSVCRECCHC